MSSDGGATRAASVITSVISVRSALTVLAVLYMLVPPEHLCCNRSLLTDVNDDPTADVGIVHISSEFAVEPA